MLGDVLRKASDAIRGTDKPTTVPGFLRPIDTNSIAKELELDRLAKERGEANLPGPESNLLDSVEQQILQKIESEWAWQGGELINNLRAYSQRLIAYSIRSEFTNLEIGANDTLTKLRAAGHRAEAELGPLREEFIGHRDALEEFKKRHRLKRIARTPPRRWTTFGLLSIFVAIESVFNGLFFAKGSEFGLVGGVGTAIGISLINVVCAFLLGLWPARFIRIRYFAVRLPAFLVTLAGLACLAALHGFAAHYRDAVASVGEANGFVVAIDSLKSHTWKLADINSYYLFGLGLLFATGAFYKGCTFDDPYPFFGVRSRASGAAREAYSDEHADLFESLEEIKNSTIETLTDGITRIPLFPQQAANIRTQRAALVQSFRGYESSVVTAANQLLSRYRDANQRSRNTPRPEHFDKSWQLPHSFLDSPEVRTLTADATGPEMDIGAALNTLRALSQRVLDEYQALLTSYPHPTKMANGNVTSSP